jgi:hypothetical protein
MISCMQMQVYKLAEDILGHYSARSRREDPIEVSS